MLYSLHVENIAVVKKLDIDFSSGFTVLTGETGSGKSIIVDSIALLLGGKFSPERLRTGESRAVVSCQIRDISPENLALLDELGVTPDEDGELFVQREFDLDGKSRSRINGRSVSTSLIRAAMTNLISIHGQHDNQKLLDPRFHLGLLDAWANDRELLSEYGELYSRLLDVRERISKASVDESEKMRRIEMLQYQIDDIFSVDPKVGEEEELSARRDLLKNFEFTRKHTQLIYRALYNNDKGASAFSLVEMAKKSLEALGDLMPDCAQNLARLSALESELGDIAEIAAAQTEGISDDPSAELDKIETRLNKLEKLRKKYGPLIEDVIAFGEDAKKQLDDLSSSDLVLKELNAELRSVEKLAAESAAKLHESRAAAAKELEGLICSQLAFLDMNSAVFTVDIQKSESFDRFGTDKVEFLLSANKGEDAKPLAGVASGGELARIMLGIKSVFAEKEGTQTLIYDEIDTGVSGKTSQKLGLVLKKCASCAQVLCVTHSAQIAAAADAHLLVSKTEANGRVETGASFITGAARVREIARIMGGNTITEKLFASAKDLINETANA